ncbi:glycosyltransferase family 4 protein [Jiella sp. MQZ9-1]|uniref:Glycosyltransferase family 4 protein n=1 Tax=Jiella flava TaxID=2816857 RepID=A0A939JVK7_9HYPH|nr:glycosyltransferase family 1 protein [Jiella flava]MBO0661386.1 glycosyltransferase family 4 protein [Jiella flava]MCD2470030.1 glycosyltransferase family 4 protein [Jiella flava]
MPSPILIEGRNLAFKNGTGIASYARNLVATLKDLGYEMDVLFDVEFALSKDNSRWNEIRLFDVNGQDTRRFRVREYARRAGRFLTAAPFGIAMREVATSGLIADTSVLHGLNGFERRQAAEMLFFTADRHLLRYGKRLPITPLRQPALMHATHPTPIVVKGCANIYTIHDLVPLRLPHMTRDNKRSTLKTLQTLAKTADKIITVSENSRRDILTFLDIEEERVVNTYQAVSLPAGYTDISSDEKLREVDALQLTPQEYFVFVGALEPKKNVERIIDAYMTSGSTYPLVIIGKLGWGYDPILDKLDTIAQRPSGAKRPHIIRLSYLPSNQVFALIENARALLMPSLYEGFGLPALEAMLLGAPVIAANSSSLPEVVADAGVLVDPYDTTAISRAIRMIDHDADLRAALAQSGPEQAGKFSQDKYDQRISALYRELL